MGVCEVLTLPSSTNVTLEPDSVAEGFPSPLDLNLNAIMGQRCFKQRRRRAEILCNTRILLSQMPHGSLTICAVAARSNVSIQTVYNLVGNRVDVLGDAVVDQLASVSQYATGREGYPNAVLSLTDAYWEMAFRYPEYTRNVVLTYFPPDRLLYDQILRQGMANLRECFRSMNAKGMLKSPEFDFRPLSTRIAALHGIVMLDGLTKFGEMLELREQLLETTQSILLGAVDAAHAAVMEEWIANRRALPAHRPSYSLSLAS